MADGRKVELSEVSARDERGPLALDRREGNDGGVTLTFDRDPSPPVEVRYVVSAKDGSGPADDPCRFVIEPDRASFCGEEALVLPVAGSAREHLRLELVADRAFHPDAASSFSLDDDTEIDASAADLRGASFAFGNLTTAQMRAPEGRDHTAALGYVSFDPRWVAAEAAGFRTSVDRWLGISRPETDPSAGLLIFAGAHRDRPIAIRRRTRGLAISADVSASYGPPTRIRIAQIFAQRTIGGALALDAARGEDAAGGLWFSEGVSRAVALFTLHELGALEDDELVRDINGYLSEIALSESDALTLGELAKRAATPSADGRERAARNLAARGLLVALDLGPADLQSVLRALVQDAATKQHGALSVEAFFAAVRSVRGDEKAGRMRRSLERGKVALDRGALGPCFELAERAIEPFELGIDLEGADRALSVRRVVEGSAAARAGVREGDSVVSIDYRPARPDVPVDIVVRRGSTEKKLHYRPAGPSKPGRAFVPSRSAPAMCRRG